MSAPEFPRPFGVPPLPNEKVGAGSIPAVVSASEPAEPIGGTSSPARFPALAGPESAAEHLRNALQVLDGQLNHWRKLAKRAGIAPEVINSWFADMAAVRRRVAAALALLEGEK